MFHFNNSTRHNVCKNATHFKPAFFFPFIFLFKTTQGFPGNTDRDTVVSHYLNPPITAHYIRFRSRAWHGHISMRVELLGCRSGFVKEIHSVKPFFEAIFRDLLSLKSWSHRTCLTWHFERWVKNAIDKRNNEAFKFILQLGCML